eukprot:1490559-Rhodomonas_salina.1
MSVTVLRIHYVMSGTVLRIHYVMSSTGIRMRYAMSGTDVGYQVWVFGIAARQALHFKLSGTAILLRACYALAATGLAYGNSIQ